MATDKILVHEEVAEEFRTMMKGSLAHAATNGSALPLVANMAAKSRLQKTLSEAIASGAAIVCGTEKQDDVPGTSIVPTVLENVDTSATLWTEENFGPLVAITTIGSDEEAVQIANSSPCGLSASIFTRDLRKGLALAKRIQSGYVTLSIALHTFTKDFQCGPYQ
jgi:acyl-CoA reductase-like NAD-dependent aldehyde dehydrogenase